MATEVDAAHVLSSYLETLEKPCESVVRDVNELPYPKDVIKLVLMHCIKLAGMGKERELLRSAFVQLADFQALSDDERRSLELFGSVITGDPEQLTDAELHNAAAKISKSGTAHVEVANRVASDMTELLEELKNAGF